MKRYRRFVALALVIVTPPLVASCTTSRAEHRGEHGAMTTTGSALRAAPTASQGGHEGHASGQASAPTIPSGYAAVSIDPASASAIGLTTAAVEDRDFSRRLRTTGIVVVDETRTSHVHTKVRGWVDGIAVNFVGQRVAPGQILCGVYSQEVYAAEMEYLALTARAGGELSARGEFAAQERHARDELVAAARRRLALWDVPKAEVERLDATREPRRTFPLVAPRAGVVVSKQILDGTFVDPSTELYTISDLTRVWLLADVYETDVASVRIGQAARLEVQGSPIPIEAKLAFVPPTIDESTRTLKVRFDLANERRELRPGAFANVTMDLALGRGLGVPENAVIRTGARTIVFVVHEGRHVTPRDVKLGPLVEGFYRVEVGLGAGEIVATGAQFLLDSETRLRAAGGAEAGHGGH